MKLHQDLNIGHNVVTAIGDGYVDINGLRHESSLLVLPRRIESSWAVAGFDALVADDFRQIVESGCEILLFGTGRRQRFPQPALLSELMAARIGVEVMDTGAACRTFNILVAESRNVAAALLLD